jgi:imidazolonepropionase-like amidohydrolase
MKTVLAAPLALLLAAPAGAVDAIVHAGVLIAEPGAPPQRERSILIEAGRITDVREGYVTEDGAAVIDLSDAFVLPGLIDSHVHLTSELGPEERLQTVTFSDADYALQGARHARATLMAGFTTVQDLGGRGEDAIFALRDAIARGDVLGPRIRASGQTVAVSGGHGDPRNGWSEDVALVLARSSICDGADDCRRAVREQIRKGADLIKITATGGVLSNTATGVDQQFTDEELRAIVETAASMGRSVTAHAHGKGGIDAALRAGVASIEHGTYMDAETIALFKEHDAVLVPTVVAGVTVAELAETAEWMTPPQRAKSREVGPNMLDMLRRAHEGGVTIAFGTDSGVGPHGTNARELELMVEAGMTPAEALRAATVTAAEHLALADEIGRLAPGMAADLIAVPADPLADISVMRAVPFVMKGGEVVKNEM